MVPWEDPGGRGEKGGNENGLSFVCFFDAYAAKLSVRPETLLGDTGEVVNETHIMLRESEYVGV